MNSTHVRHFTFPHPSDVGLWHHSWLSQQGLGLLQPWSYWRIVHMISMYLYNIISKLIPFFDSTHIVLVTPSSHISNFKPGLRLDHLSSHIMFLWADVAQSQTCPLIPLLYPPQTSTCKEVIFNFPFFLFIFHLFFGFLTIGYFNFNFFSLKFLNHFTIFYFNF